MPQTDRMIALAVGAVVLTGVAVASLNAQTPDEIAIRQLRADSAAYTDDAFFFSGAYGRPIIGAEARRTAPAVRGSEHRNFTAQETIQHLQIAKSGDLAYAYGTSVLRWEGREPFEAAFLRVYRKEGGQWKIAAMFTRPLENE